MAFPPINYLSLAVISSSPSPDSGRFSLSNSRVDGKILDVEGGSVRILLRRKLRRTATGGSIYVGFVLQEGNEIATEDDQVQVVHARMESTTGESWEATIDPGFRALQHLSKCDSTNRLDVSPHLLLAKNEQYAVCVTPRNNGAISLADVLSDDTIDLTEGTMRELFRDIVTGIQSLHGLGLCHRNINMETIVVVKQRPPIAMVSNLESCRRVDEVNRPANQIPQCVPPEVWKGVESTIQDGAQLDLWAAGVVLSVLLLKHPLFQAPLLSDQAFYAVLHSTDSDSTRFPVTNDGLELLRSMLAEEPSNRLTLAQIMEHKWLHQGSDE